MSLLHARCRPYAVAQVARALPLLLALACAGCAAPASDQPTVPHAAEISKTGAKPLYTLAITPVKDELQVGTEHAMSCEATYAGGSHAVVTQSSTWASSDPSVARMEAGGILVAVSPGRAQISARHGQATDQVEVTVIER